jgi:hypothetical protein
MIGSIVILLVFIAFFNISKSSARPSYVYRAYSLINEPHHLVPGTVNLIV